MHILVAESKKKKNSCYCDLVNDCVSVYLISNCFLNIPFFIR